MSRNKGFMTIEELSVQLARLNRRLVLANTLKEDKHHLSKGRIRHINRQIRRVQSLMERPDVPVTVSNDEFAVRQFNVSTRATRRALLQQSHSVKTST